MNRKEYDSGYQAAIDAIRKQLQAQKSGQTNSNNQGGQGQQQSDDDLQMPPGMGQAPPQGGGSGNGSQSNGENSRGRKLPRRDPEMMICNDDISRAGACASRETSLKG